MRRDEAIARLRAHKAELSRFKVQSLAVFGSVARDEAGPDSDVDVLVYFEQPVGYFQLARLQMYLEEILGSAVDLATEGALHPMMREQILKEAVLAA